MYTEGGEARTAAPGEESRLVTEQTSHAPVLQKRFDDQSAVIGIAGLGYVGLPLALTFAEKGFRVLGFDVDVAKVEALNAGRNYIQHLDGTRLSRAVAEQRFQATADFGRLAEPDALIICVPTPLTPQREPDMSYVVNTVQQIRARLRPGQLVVLESTTYPGTTDELVRQILEQSGLRCGHDFFLAFSPEREDRHRDRRPSPLLVAPASGSAPHPRDVDRNRAAGFVPPSAYRRDDPVRRRLGAKNTR